MEKELLKIYNIATKYAEKRRGMLANYKEPEDFGAYCLERKLKDQYSKLYWMFIDFIRKDTGRGERGFDIRKKNVQYAASLDARRGTGESEYALYDFVGHEEPDFGIRSDAALVECHLREQSKRVNQIFYFRKIGLSFKEIGKKFSITESRAAQIFSHHSEKIKKEKKKRDKEVGEKLLSKAESDVYTYILKGMSNQQIADKLFVSEKTVKFHCGSIFKKKEVKTRHELIAKHFNNDMIDIKPREVKKVSNLPINQNQYNNQLKEDNKESVHFINEKFGVNDTVSMLQHMMKEVTKDGINANNVNAACNCVARLNETIDTAIKAARFLKNG